MHMIDGGDLDDKLIGVVPGSDFDAYNNLSELEAAFPGIEEHPRDLVRGLQGPRGDRR